MVAFYFKRCYYEDKSAYKEENMEFKVDKKISENITVYKTNLTINKYAVVFGELDKPVFVALRKSKTSAINVAAKALKKTTA